jgi:hypothetical protein
LHNKRKDSASELKQTLEGTSVHPENLSRARPYPIPTFRTFENLRIVCIDYSAAVDDKSSESDEEDGS